METILLIIIIFLSGVEIGILITSKVLGRRYEKTFRDMLEREKNLIRRQ